MTQYAYLTSEEAYRLRGLITPWSPTLNERWPYAHTRERTITVVANGKQGKESVLFYKLAPDRK